MPLAANGVKRLRLRSDNYTTEDILVGSSGLQDPRESSDSPFVLWQSRGQIWGREQVARANDL